MTGGGSRSVKSGTRAPSSIRYAIDHISLLSKAATSRSHRLVLSLTHVASSQPVPAATLRYASVTAPRRCCATRPGALDFYWFAPSDVQLWPPPGRTVCRGSAAAGCAVAVGEPSPILSADTGIKYRYWGGKNIIRFNFSSEFSSHAKEIVPWISFHFTKLN